MKLDPIDLLTKSYHFDLPEELIAQRPINSDKRDESKLLVYHHKTGKIEHTYFYHIGEFIPQESLLVFNQSKVFPSRLKGHKKTGGEVEVFLLSHQPDINGEYEALIRARAKKKIKDEFYLPNGLVATITEILENGTFKIKLNYPIDGKYLEHYALLPIPPYIRKGESDSLDKKDYQTIYAKEMGSVAAPTAGLHFTSDLMEKLQTKKIESAFVTLHVGLGTFRPVKVQSLKDHQMHFEKFQIDAKNLNKIQNNKNVFAVGTTSLRVLESMQMFNVVADQEYSTNIFLHPGVEVKSISGLITNFHLPESTLLVLISALIGRAKALEIYSIAIKEKYRFFSYGDAMLILL